MNTAAGPFEITMHAEPPYFEKGGLSLGLARFDKRFEGALQGTSEVRMLAVRTPDPSSRAYVALERIEGSLDGKHGSFVVTHRATMSPTEGPKLEITIVAGTGTDELRGIAGVMRIRIEAGGAHFYEIDYAITSAPA